MSYERLNGTIKVVNGSPSRAGSPTLSNISDGSDRWEDSEDGGGKSRAFGLEDIAKSSIDAGNDVDTETDHEDTDEEGLEMDDFGGFSSRGSHTSAQTFMLYTPDEEQSVIRKFDSRLVLFVALLYMLSFLDRSSMLCTRRNGAIS